MVIKSSLVFPKLLILIFALTASVLAAEPRDISIELEVIRLKYKLPACASAVMEDGRITALGATGVRRIDASVQVTNTDIWHIGSCTKSMTATLIGVLVDEGKLRWNTPVADIFPDVPCDASWRKVSVWDLVTQRSGLGTVARAMWPSGGTKRQQRGALARLLLAHPPAEPPGKFAYSNLGYGLLGAIIERASGQSYEDFLRAKIFLPLGLKTAGFGAPDTPGKLDQPWGHRRSDDHLTPVEPSPENEFPPALAPAGCVHMSLTDFARYAAWISSGQARLVKPETFARLQTPPEDSSYAGGLWTSVLPGIGGEAVCHTGQMAGFFAVFYADPHRACVSVFNTEGGGWEWLGDEITAVALKAAH